MLYYIFIWQNYFCDQDFIPLDKISTFGETLKNSDEEESKVSDKDKEELMKDLDLSLDLSDKVCYMGTWWKRFQYIIEWNL